VTDRHMDKHTENPSAADVGGLLEALARHHAPDVLGEALRQARMRAQAELTDRLTRAILDEATHNEAGPGAYGDHDGAPGGRATPIAGPSPSPPPSPSDQTGWSTGQPRSDALSESERGLYAYVVTWENALDADGVRAACDDRGLRLITHGGLGLVVGEVEIGRFAALGEKAGDGQPLSEESELVVLARQHDAVVRAVFAQRPVLPLRFATIFPDENAALRLLSSYAEQARSWLERVRGHREWGVRARSSGQEPDVGDFGLDEQFGTTSGGARRERSTTAQTRQRHTAESTRSLHETLTRYATDSVTRAHGRDLLLDAAYLLPADREKAFQAAVEQLLVDLTREGVDVEITGPWPPYSFTQLEWNVDEKRMEVTHQ
jgi:hypothetical protein